MKTQWLSFKQVDAWENQKKAGDTTSKKPQGSGKPKEQVAQLQKKSQGLGKPQPQPSHPNLRVIFVWESVFKKKS